MIPIKKQTLAYLYLTITTSGWGSLYVATKLVLLHVPLPMLLFLRFLVGGIALWLVLLRKKPEPIAREDRKYVVAIGVFGYFCSAGAQMLGTKLANVSVASLINAMNPVSIILFASLMLKEEFTRTKAVALTAAVAGAYIIIGGAGASGQLLGVFFSILSVLTWSAMTVVARRINQKYDSLTITTYGMLVAAACAFPLALYQFASTGAAELFQPEALLLVLYIGLICTALSHYLWNKSLSLIDAGSCSLFYPLQPLMATLLGWLVLNERIGLGWVAGAVLIIGGVLFSMLGGPARPVTET